jgi:hypothetical protein
VEERTSFVESTLEECKQRDVREKGSSRSRIVERVDRGHEHVEIFTDASEHGAGDDPQVARRLHFADPSPLSLGTDRAPI